MHMGEGERLLRILIPEAGQREPTIWIGRVAARTKQRNRNYKRRGTGKYCMGVKQRLAGTTCVWPSFQEFR